MFVLFIIVKSVLAAPPNTTPVAPLNLVPVIDTLVPPLPNPGENVAIVGGTKKFVVVVLVPAGVVSVIGPLEAFAGTVAWTSVSEVGAKLAITPLNFTPVVPVKNLPEMK